MITKDHYFIGIKIVEDKMEYISLRKKKLFLFGCIQPDLNPFTYIKGSLHAKKFQGHNYESSYKLVRRYLNSLGKKSELSIWAYYKLGKLLHYVADSFTYPHNAAFEGTVREHIEYEENLHQQLLCCKELCNTIIEHDQQITMERYEKFHQSYLKRRENIQDDITSILQICQMVSHAFIPLMIDEGLNPQASTVI